MNTDTTNLQITSIQVLSKRGYTFTNWLSYGSAMMQKANKFSYSFIEVDTDGNCNGEPLEQFLKHSTK